MHDSRYEIQYQKQYGTAKRIIKRNKLSNSQWRRMKYDRVYDTCIYSGQDTAVTLESFKSAERNV